MRIFSHKRTAFPIGLYRINYRRRDRHGTTIHEYLPERSLNQIVSKRVILIITREKGIPTIHIQTAKKKFVEDLQKSKDIEVRGHHFCECFVNNRWILVDPSRGSVLQNYDNNDFNLGQYYIFSKSTDIFETGISNVTDNNQMIKRLFSGFDLERFHPANSIEQEISR